MKDLSVWWLILPAVLFGWYLTYSAARLDRLHHGVEKARAALDAQLARRATQTLEVAQTLDPASAIVLIEAATRVAAAQEIDVIAESDLTVALVAVFDGPDALPAPSAQALALWRDLGQACQRVQYARRFHNVAVNDTWRVRRKVIVRWFRLAGRAALPQSVELDDRVPEALILSD